MALGLAFLPTLCMQFQHGKSTAQRPAGGAGIPWRGKGWYAAPCQESLAQRNSPHRSCLAAVYRQQSRLAPVGHGSSVSYRHTGFHPEHRRNCGLTHWLLPMNKGTNNQENARGNQGPPELSSCGSVTVTAGASTAARQAQCHLR